MNETPWGDANRWFLAALVTPEEGGGFSVEAPELPGVASQGDTVDEALLNLIEAANGAIDQYTKDGVPIPWKQALMYSELQKDSRVRWIAVERRGTWPTGKS